MVTYSESPRISLPLSVTYLLNNVISEVMCSIYIVNLLVCTIVGNSESTLPGYNTRHNNILYINLAVTSAHDIK
jgi:hypothetical protein